MSSLDCFRPNFERRDFSEIGADLPEEEEAGLDSSAKNMLQRA